MSKQSEAIPWSQLSLLPVDSHVRMSAPQGKGRVSKTAPGQDSGQSFTESFANYDPDTSSWRTSQGCLLTGWAEFSATWPKSGTMRSGRCYRQQMSAHRTSESESLLWPTPRVTMPNNLQSNPDINPAGRIVRASGQTFAVNLQDAVQMWPTPSATPRGPHTGAVAGTVSNDGMTRVSANGTRWGATLETAVQRWPTPRAADYKGVQKPSPSTKRRVEEGRANLPEALQESRLPWPTPAARDYKGQNSVTTMTRKLEEGKRAQQGQLPNVVAMKGDIGQLNPTWVEWLMGFPSGWTDLKA